MTTTGKQTYVEVRDATVQATLDAIDDATTLRCASCPRVLDAHGSSPYWCSQDCQRTWHEAYAAEPREVLDGPDGVLDDPEILVYQDPSTWPSRHDHVHCDHGEDSCCCCGGMPECSLSGSGWTYFPEPVGWQWAASPNSQVETGGSRTALPVISGP
jgi:hypothetical protein